MQSGVQISHLFGLWNMDDRMARGAQAQMLTEPPQANVYRRDVLCGSGAFVFSVLVASLLRGSKPVYAQPIASDVPEVDRVSVRVSLIAISLLSR